MTRIEELEQSIDESVEKFRLEINKFKAELEHIKKIVELAELKESKKEGKWKPAYKEKYWIRDDGGEISFDNWDNHEIDIWRYNNMPLFPTKEDCERYWHFMDTVKEKSYEFSRKEWEDENIKKYIICYAPFQNKIFVEELYLTTVFGEIYFKEKSDAQYIIDNFKEELMTYWL